ncbi:NAD(P)H-dependent oxidoreductase [Pseudodonghicola flavimaris]|uniref:NAD(P)H-dependent oxidoreductase n=1 Tax=Pseudodonghicola flavimaris TaxID=3050036 RepID=A0ABT7EXJ7_9RHOB|nr:NAD(P)H-dependent oxidoreductase [Pseudodonghicola flavimaris]MDK3017058.1 NAD(P)H-dependent oxidoreductase [Pseudodonghicola flavimaris]
MTPTLKLFAFCGSDGAQSKTAILVKTAVAEVAQRLPVDATFANIAPFMQVRLGQYRDTLPDDARAILEGIETCDLLVVGSPVYKGSYSGAFKHVFDLVDPDKLLHKPVLICASGGGQRHALMVEHQLRPLFGFFGASSAPVAIYAGAADFADGAVADPALKDRIALAAQGFAQMAGQPAARG